MGAAWGVVRLATHQQCGCRMMFDSMVRVPHSRCLPSTRHERQPRLVSAYGLGLHSHCELSGCAPEVSLCALLALPHLEPRGDEAGNHEDRVLGRVAGGAVTRHQRQQTEAPLRRLREIQHAFARDRKLCTLHLLLRPRVHPWGNGLGHGPVHDALVDLVHDGLLNLERCGHGRPAHTR